MTERMPLRICRAAFIPLYRGHFGHCRLCPQCGRSFYCVPVRGLAAIRHPPPKRLTKYSVSIPFLHENGPFPNCSTLSSDLKGFSLEFRRSVKSSEAFGPSHVFHSNDNPGARLEGVELLILFRSDFCTKIDHLFYMLIKWET